jgi:hypothetical protein
VKKQVRFSKSSTTKTGKNSRKSTKRSLEKKEVLNVLLGGLSIIIHFYKTEPICNKLDCPEYQLLRECC